MLGIVKQLQTEISELRGTVEALQNQLNAAMTSPLALAASTQYGPTLVATQGVQTAEGCTGLKRPREEGVEAAGRLPPPKKRSHRGRRRQRTAKPKDEAAGSVKVEQGEENLADDVAGSAPTPKPEPLQQLESGRQLSGFEFTMDALVRAATPAQGLDAGHAQTVQYAAGYLMGLGVLEQHGYARRAESNGRDPVTQFLVEFDEAESDGVQLEQAQSTSVPAPQGGDEDLYGA